MRRLVAVAALAASFAVGPLTSASACDRTRPDCNPPGEVVDRYLCIARQVLAGEPVQPACF